MPVDLASQHLRVETPVFHEAPMVAALPDDTVIEDNDLVGIHHSRQAVGDDEGRRAGLEPPDRLHHE